MKNLIIDGQILQTGAWHRGMGKYMLQVLQGLNDRPPKDTKVTILFNSSLDADSGRTDIVKYLYPDIDLIECSLPLAAGKSGSIKSKDYKKQLTEFVEAEFSDGDNYYLITSLFLFDFFAEFPENCHNLLMFYDLTPLLLWRDLGGYFPPDLYMPRFQKLFEAEQIFAISETTRQDVIGTFGLSPDSVTNINGGFTKIAESTKKPDAFAVPEKYILFPTGDLPHKNNDIAIRGFERYCHNNSKIPLLITSSFSDASKERLLALSPNIVFTGNVTDEELEWLYENASAILFASKYEGLGMPVLDAVANKKPIIASRIPVFEEMSKSAFYYFEPHDADSLDDALKGALSQKDFNKKQRHYPQIMHKYTWQNTVEALRSYPEKNHAPLTETGPVPKRKLAVVCLNPGLRDQIGRLSEVLHASLAERFTVDYYFDANGVHFRDMERPTFLDYLDCKAFDISMLNIESYKDYASIVYLLDASALPSRLAQRAAVLPGIAVLGDLDNLDGQAEMLKQAIIDNQIAVHRLESANYENCRALTAKIEAGLTAKASEPNAADTILRRRGSNRSIIKKLKSLVVL